MDLKVALGAVGLGKGKIVRIKRNSNQSGAINQDTQTRRLGVVMVYVRIGARITGRGSSFQGL